MADFRRMPSILRFVIGLPTLAATLHGAAAVRQVTVAAAPVERAAQVVTITLPRELANGAILRDATGQPVPLQVEADLSAKFIIARQAVGQSLRFTLEPGRTPDQGNVQVVEEPSPPRPGKTPGIARSTSAAMIQGKTGRLRVSVGGRPILCYQMDRDAVPREDIDPKWRRAGYLHPVLTPNGQTVTEDYPKDDPAQHGIGTVWRDLVFKGRSLDFTDPKGHPERIEFGGIDRTWGGPVSGGFASWHRWLESSDPGATVVLNESWELTAYSLPPELKGLNLFDLTVSQAVPVGESFTVSTSSRGGIAVRTPGGWSRTVALWSSNEKLTDGRKNEGGPVFLAQGPVVANTAGLGVLLAKKSMFSGWWMADPGADFLAKLEQSEMRPGRPLEMRQRFVVFDGPPDEALLEALWHGYTEPAVVTIAP